MHRDDYSENTDYIIKVKGYQRKNKQCNLKLLMKSNELNCFLQVGDNNYHIQFYNKTENDVPKTT